jgi:hypothetical protein
MKLKIFFFLLTIILSTVIYQGLLKPFPFFKVEYYESLEEFNNSPKGDLEFYKITFTPKITDDLKNKLLTYSESTLLEKIKISTAITRSIQEKSLGNIIKSYDDILNVNENFLEICSESSKIFVVLMNLLNEQSRILWLNGHTVVEVWDNKQWIFVDPSSNVIAFDRFNNKISLAETVLLYPEVKFQSINYKYNNLWDYRLDADKLNHIIESNEIIFTMNNMKNYDFDRKEDKIKRVIYSLFPNDNYFAKQFTGYDEAKKVGNLGITIYRLLNF